LIISKRLIEHEGSNFFQTFLRILFFLFQGTFQMVF
jgi:hypothetical protein